MSLISPISFGRSYDYAIAKSQSSIRPSRTRCPNLFLTLQVNPVGVRPKKAWVDTVSLDWYSKPKAREEVLKFLKKFHLDEGAIEAKAIQSKLSELETLDRMLTLLESRRNKALRSIADYREGFADQARKASDRLIDGGAVIQLEDRSVQRSA
jgi:flagellar motility protein MotE (MotC chaperone)